jgi:hypothetical protein
MSFQQAPCSRITTWDRHQLMRSGFFSNDEDYTMPTKDDCQVSNIRWVPSQDRMYVELKSHPGMLVHKDESIILDFPLENRHFETPKSSSENFMAFSVLKRISESVRKIHLGLQYGGRGIAALNGEDSLDSDDEDDLGDSIHLTKRRFDSERVRFEERRKGLEHTVGCIDSAFAPMIVQQQTMRAMAA